MHLQRRLQRAELRERWDCFLHLSCSILQRADCRMYMGVLRAVCDESALPTLDQHYLLLNVGLHVVEILPFPQPRATENHRTTCGTGSTLNAIMLVWFLLRRKQPKYIGHSPVTYSLDVIMYNNDNYKGNPMDFLSNFRDNWSVIFCSVWFSLPVLLTQSGRFTIVNQAYRASLADRDSSDYKQMSAEIEKEVGK